MARNWLRQFNLWAKCRGLDAKAGDKLVTQPKADRPLQAVTTKKWWRSLK